MVRCPNRRDRLPSNRTTSSSSTWSLRTATHVASRPPGACTAGAATNMASSGSGGGGGAAASYPTQVSGGLTFRSLIQGAANATCAITVDGVTYCWGAGEDHVLGTGDEEVRSGPTPVLGGKPEFASVAGSSTHTCAVTVGGAAYCWGINDQGHLGNGTQD